MAASGRASRPRHVHRWCADTTAYGAEPAITTYGKNTPTGPAYPTTAYQVFYNDVDIEAGKQVVAVRLPQSGAIHIFATTFTNTPPAGTATGGGGRLGR